MLDTQTQQHCLQPCCLNTTYQYQYEFQYQYEDCRLEYQYPDLYQDLSPSPDPSFTQSFAIMGVDGNIQEISGPSPSPSPDSASTQSFAIMSVDGNMQEISGVSPSPSPDPAFKQSFTIMSVDGNIQGMSGASPSPSEMQQQQQQYQQQCQQQCQQQYQQPTPQQEKGLMEALEIARETEDGMRDPTIRNLLETAIARIWNKVLEEPDTYIMAKDEFAIFNFFQHRFLGNEMAIAARRRFWSSYSG